MANSTLPLPNMTLLFKGLHECYNFLPNKMASLYPKKTKYEYNYRRGLNILHIVQMKKNGIAFGFISAGCNNARNAFIQNFLLVCHKMWVPKNYREHQGQSNKRRMTTLRSQPTTLALTNVTLFT